MNGLIINKWRYTIYIVMCMYIYIRIYDVHLCFFRLRHPTIRHHHLSIGESWPVKISVWMAWWQDNHILSGTFLVIYIYIIYTQLYTITNIFTSSVYMHHTLSYNICIYTEQHLEQTCDVIHIISYINVNVHQIYTCIISYIYIYHHISTYIYSTS